MGAPAARVHELSREWARLGHQVTVLTGFPNHPDGKMPEAYRRQMRRKLTVRETVDGVSVVRTALYAAANTGSVGRMLNYVSFFVSALMRGLVLDRPDVIIGTSPQPLCAAAAWLLALRFSRPFVFEVRDLWPESLPAVGQTSEDSWLYRSIEAVVRVLYRSADLIVPVTEAFIPTIRQYAPDTPLAVIENGVDLDRFQPPANRPELRRTLGVDRRFVVSYIGTIGMAHGLETLLDTAGLLKARFADALVLVAGEGAERERIERLAAERQLTNIRFLGQRPRSEVADLVGASDACLVLLRQSEVFKTVLPSKMLEFMACGTPTVVTVDGFARQLVTESNSGVYVPNNDAVALAAAIIDLSRDPGARAWLGGNGREFVRRRFSRRTKAVEYLRALEGAPALHSHARTAPRALPRTLQTGPAQQQG
jgi:glycosyltransferase involved in cell wall biosynthesis